MTTSSPVSGSGGETASDPSAWTPDLLYLHINARITDLSGRLDERYENQEKALSAALAGQEKAVTAALAAQEKAVNKAETANERRLESVNEFRGQMADMIRTLIPRSEADARFTALAEKLDELSARMSEVDRRTASRLDLIQGRASGISMSAGAIAGGIAAVTSVVVAVIVVVNVLLSA